MIIPVRCFTCGKVLADKYDYYVKEVAKLQAKVGLNPDEAKPDKDNPKYKYFEKVHTGPIMDSLGLTRYCCRRHLLGAVDMMDVI